MTAKVPQKPAPKQDRKWNPADLGWDDFFASHARGVDPSLHCYGRIALETKKNSIVYSEFGEMTAILPAKWHYRATDNRNLPAVGDWVLLERDDPARIIEILPRKTLFSRKIKGKQTREQILAANVDIGFIVIGLDCNYNLRRIERYMMMTAASGAQPVLILNKKDLAADAEAKAQEVRRIFSAPVIVTCAQHSNDLAPMRELLKRGVTGVVIGSSGVGKSTLINTLAGEEIQHTQQVNPITHKGRHTTTRRELLLLPDHGLLIDTPGMRELQAWIGKETVHNTFADILELASECRFNDCRHLQEPGCAVRQAVENGRLDSDRLESYHDLLKEVQELHRRRHWKKEAGHRSRLKPEP
ncbi:ribosome small subunit-dependent GTPase A [candidate division KSB1 bacterium]|nr:ribosome small subunit-dependent GTPase A [candidate division KSB1 bacterium]